jgi:polysaccharide pyruvyl transferase WcaK-like protein
MADGTTKPPISKQDSALSAKKLSFLPPSGALRKRPLARLKTQPDDLLPSLVRFGGYALRRGAMKVEDYAKAASSGYFLHYGVHDPRGNAGDTVLYRAVRGVFDQQLGKQNWVRRHLRNPTPTSDVERINRDAAAIVIGGGGLMMSETSRPTASGWQWEISKAEMEKISAPIIVYAVGYNQFRGSKPFEKGFNDHIETLVRQSAFFGVRNSGSLERLKDHLPAELHAKASFQPCPTTVLRHFHPSMTPTSHATPSKTLALNLAFDKPEKRYGADADKILGRVGKAMQWASEAGWKIKVAVHGFDDDPAVPFMRSLGIPVEIVRVNLLGWNDIVKFYAETPVTIGMRGHAQMIPFGCGNAIISLISHDKLGFFLKDIGHPEWGFEMSGASVTDQIVADLERYWADPEKRHAAVSAAQAPLWQATKDNLATIQHQLANWKSR